MSRKFKISFVIETNDNMNSKENILELVGPAISDLVEFEIEGASDLLYMVDQSMQIEEV